MQNIITGERHLITRSPIFGIIDMAKKIVQPTDWEQAQIDKALRKKYPHMLKESWIKRLKKKVQKQLSKRRRSKAYQLGVAGVSKKKTKRMVGK